MVKSGVMGRSERDREIDYNLARNRWSRSERGLGCTNRATPLVRGLANCTTGSERASNTISALEIMIELAQGWS